MKTVRVVAAVIKAKNENGEPIIFATQRGYGDFKGGWEFPGGKIEEGETPQEALKREISAGSQSTLFNSSFISHFADSCSLSTKSPFTISHQKQSIDKWNVG